MTLHDEIEIEDMDWSDDLQAFTYQCPCGDLFQITMEELAAGEGLPSTVAAAAAASGTPTANAHWLLPCLPQARRLPSAHPARCMCG